MSEIAERVTKIVVEHLGVDESKVTEEASFIDDLGADSLDTVELVMAFEEEFNVEIPDDAAEKIGADPLRLLYCLQDPSQELRFGFNVVKEPKNNLNIFYNIMIF